MPFAPGGTSDILARLISPKLQDAIGQLSPDYVLLPHTYQTRDFAPKHARPSAAAGRAAKLLIERWPGLLR